MSIHDLFKADIALVPGTLRGYRAWRWVPGFDNLWSTGMSTHRWRQPPLLEEARCLGHPFAPHQAPSVDCACGIYGWYHPDDSRIVPASVFGVIAASGRIVMGTHGFRAARAQVVAVTTEDPEIRDMLSGLGYQVFDNREQLLGAFPPQDVSALVDHQCDGTCPSEATSWRTLRITGSGPSSGLLQHAQVSVQQLAGSLATFRTAANAAATAPRL